MAAQSSEQVLADLQADYGSLDFDSRWEVQRQPYWDKRGYGTAASPGSSPTEIDFWNLQAGATDPVLGVTKTLEQTNLVTQNQISGNQCYIVKSIAFDIQLAPKVRQQGTAVASSTDFSARQELFAQFVTKLAPLGVLTWTIQQKKKMITAAPFITFPPAFGLGLVIPPGVGGLTPITGGGNNYAALSSYDLYEHGDSFSLGQPLFLGPNTAFQMTINFPLTGAAAPAATAIYGASADQAATIWICSYMFGFLVRPRQ